jgi:hypothetical protein
MHPFNPIGKLLSPLIAAFSESAFLVVCLIFAVIAYRRTKHSGFLFILVGVVISLFNRFLYSEIGLQWWRSLDDNFLYTALKLYNVFIAHSVFWLFLALAIWRLGIGRTALNPSNATNGSDRNA